MKSKTNLGTATPGTVELTRHLLNESEVARQYGLTTSWLRKRRRIGDGPEYLRLGRMVRYERSALEEWLNEHRTK